jgi:hypothetical protein
MIYEVAASRCYTEKVRITETIALRVEATSEAEARKIVEDADEDGDIEQDMGSGWNEVDTQSIDCGDSDPIEVYDVSLMEGETDADLPLLVIQES